MDPYAVLNLPQPDPAQGMRPTCTLEQLRGNYKLLAKQLHPDKCPAHISREDATSMFQVLTEAYNQVRQHLRESAAERPFYDLKSESAEAAEAQAGGGGGADPAAQRFNIKRFNSAFDEVKHTVSEQDATFFQERGYSDWMQRSPATVEQAREVERRRREKQLAVQRYREPEPAALIARPKSMTFCEIARGGKADDYSGRVARVDYGDYRIAHTTTSLADRSALQRADAAATLTVEALEAQRADANYEMTEDDLRAEGLRKQYQARLDEKRRAALSRHEALIRQQHEIANRLLLN